MIELNLLSSEKPSDIFTNNMNMDIYSKNMRKNTLKNKTNWDWDLHTNFNYIRYIYEKPLCYQLFPMTENRKNWHKNSFPFSKMLSDLFISWTNLENEPEPGFSIVYFLAKLIPFLLLFLVLWILYRFVPVFKTMIKIKKRK